VTTASSKIVIVAGQRIPVPAGTDNEVIRQQLIGMGFADVANAEIKKGTEGAQETVEFVKKAGTKGLAPGDLIARLRQVRPDRLAPAVDMRLVNRLLAEQLTFEEAVAEDRAIDALQQISAQAEPKGARLCRALDELAPVADPTPRAW
jgi:hypothetical protein